MADETLDWELKLADMMSGPLGRIEDRFASLEKTMEGLQGSGIDKALGKKAKDVEAKVAKALEGARTKLSGARGDFAQAWSALLTISSPVGARLASRLLDPMLAAMRSGGSRVRNAVGGAFSSVMGSHMAPVFQRAGERWQTSIAPVGRALGRSVGGVFSSVFSTHLGPVGQRLSESFSAASTRAKTMFGSAGSALSRFGAATMTVLGPLGAGFSKLLGGAGGLATAIGTRLGPALASLGPAMKDLAGFAGKGLGALVGIGAALAVAAGAITVAAGKWAISGLSFKEDTINAFKTMLGTEDAAQRVFKQATKFAATTPFSTEEVVGGFQKFLTAGFKENQLDTMMKAVGDVGANMGTEKMDQVITGLSQIKAKGKLQGEEMMQLAEAGVGQDAVFAALSKTLGVSKAATQKKVSAGQVTGEQGIAAVLEAIKTTQSGGKLGSAMEGKSKTLSGLWSSLMDIPSTLLFASDLDNVTKPIKGAISGVIDAFNEGTPLFKRATAAFGRIGEAWGKAFGAIAGTDSSGLFENLIDGAENFFTSLAPFAEGFFPQLITEVTKLLGLFGDQNTTEDMRKRGEDIAKSLGLLAGAMITLGGAVAWLIDKFVWVFEKLGSAAAWLATDDGLSSDEETMQKSEEARRQLQMLRAGQTGGGGLAANGAALPPSVSTTVGQVIVQVAPGQQDAGIVVANQVQAQTPQALTNFATEMGQ